MNSAPSGSRLHQDDERRHVDTRLQTADFGFSDNADNPRPTAWRTVIITTTPSVGSLTLNGAGVAPGQTVSATDIATGKLVFRPAANANGTPYASFTFQVQDDGGTANGGQNTDPTPNSYTFNVTSVNDEPSGANGQFQVDASGIRDAHPVDFGFSDVNDSPANSLQAVKITFTPSAVGGDHLRNNGADVGTGQFISVADLNAGHLVYTAPASGQHRDDHVPGAGRRRHGVNRRSRHRSVAQRAHDQRDTISTAWPNGIDFTVTTNEDTLVRLHAPTTSPAVTPSPMPRTTTSRRSSSPRIPMLGVLIVQRRRVVTAVQQFRSRRSTSPRAAWCSRRCRSTARPGTGTFTTIGFEIQDDGGTVPMHDTDTTPNTVTIGVRPVNDAPSSADAQVSTPEDNAYIFQPTDFPIADGNDSPANNLLAVRIAHAADGRHAVPQRHVLGIGAFVQRQRHHRPACSRSRRPPTPTAAPTPASPSRCRTTAARTSAARISTRRPTR